MKQIQEYELILDIFDSLPRKAKILILENDRFNKELIHNIGLALAYPKIESPIEKIFLTAFLICDKYNIYIDPQTKIKCGDNTYYADFTITYDHYVNHMFHENFKLVIECDGYEFHQKSKKQVEYGNKREYDLKMEGYEILRFSGSEIYNQPIQCVKKVFDYISKVHSENGIFHE